MVTAEKINLDTLSEEEKLGLSDALKNAFTNFENCVKGAHKSFNNKSIQNFKKNSQAFYSTITKCLGQETEDPNTWLINIAGLALNLNIENLNESVEKAFKTALENRFKIPDSLIIDWKLEDKVPVKNRKDKNKDSDSEEFFDASDSLVTTLKNLATSLAQNKLLKIDSLKYPTQNVVSWFERFELLTTRWTEEDRGYEVVSYFEEIALQKYQLLRSDEFNYQEIKKHMIKELRPKFSIRSLFSEFFSAKQRPDEKVDNFAHRLLTYIKDADNEQKIIFDKELGNVFVNGCDKKIQNFLLSEKTKDFNILWNLAKKIEKNNEDQEEISFNQINLSENFKASQVKFQSKNNSNEREKFCHFCGKNNHYSVDCISMKQICESLKNFKRPEICQFCKKPGHKEEKCFRKNKVPQNRNTKLPNKNLN